MALTISLSTLLLSLLLAAVAYGVWRLYELFYVEPKRFISYWKAQGIDGVPFSFPLGQLPAIQKAADSDTIVEYAEELCAKYGGVQTQQVGPMCNLVIYSPEMVRHICTSKAHCYHKAPPTHKEIIRPLLHNGLLLSEGEYWKQQRQLLSPGFHYFYLQEMTPIIVQCIEEWCVSVEAKLAASSDGSVSLEMSHELATMTLDSVATAAFGTGFRADSARADLFIHSLKEVLEAMQARSLNLVGFLPLIKDLPLPSLKTVQRGCATIDRIVGEIVRDRKEGRSHVVAGGEHAGSEALRQAAEARGEEVRRRDLLDLLLDAQKNMPPGQTLTDRGVEEESINFIAAGAETTSNLCIWMLHRILTEPASAEGATAAATAAGATSGQTLLQRVLAEIDSVCPLVISSSSFSSSSSASPAAADDDAAAACSPPLSLDQQLKDLKFLEAVAYESLRLHPPAPNMPKVAIEAHDVVLGGKHVHIPKDTLMIINANVIHRLPEYWPDPLTFKPERFLATTNTTTTNNNTSAADSDTADVSSAPSSSKEKVALSAEEKARKAAAPFAFLGFAAGPRKCIGKNLAMLEIKVIFTMLLQRFSFEVLPEQYIAANPITRLPRKGIHMRVRRRVRSAAEHSSSSASAGTEDAASSAAAQEGMRQRAANLTVLKPTGMI